MEPSGGDDTATGCLVALLSGHSVRRFRAEPMQSTDLTIEGTQQRSWPVKKRVRPHRSGHGPYRRPTTPSRGNAGRSLIAVRKLLTKSELARATDGFGVAAAVHQTLVAADGSGRADGSRHLRSSWVGGRPPRTDFRRDREVRAGRNAQRSVINSHNTNTSHTSAETSQRVDDDPPGAAPSRR